MSDRTEDLKLQVAGVAGATLFLIPVVFLAAAVIYLAVTALF